MNELKNLIIDGHSHVTIPIENHIRLMNEAGIDKTILFRTIVHPEIKQGMNEIKAEMQHLSQILSGDSIIAKQYGDAANQELFKAVRKYPDRFYCFGNIPIDMELFPMIELLQQLIDRDKIIGLGEFTLANGQIPKLETVFNASNQTAQLPLWIHCFNPLVLDDIKQIGMLARKYPKVPVIIGHMGGSNWLETIDIVKQHPNMYIDTSACFSTLVLKIVISELPEKALFGVDYPYGDMLFSRKMIERVCTNKKILAGVLAGNISNLLNNQLLNAI